MPRIFFIARPSLACHQACGFQREKSAKRGAGVEFCGHPGRLGPAIATLCGALDQPEAVAKIAYGALRGSPVCRRVADAMRPLRPVAGGRAIGF
jgi:hypothetical protein